MKVLLSTLALAGMLTGTSTAQNIRSLTLPAGTRIAVRLGQSLDTKRDRPGTRFIAHVAAPVMRGTEVVLPKGAVCHGHIVESRASGRLKGRARLSLTLDSVQVNGKLYTLAASTSAYASRDHKARNGALIGGGAGTGAAIGAIAGGGVGALVGAGAGAAAGTAGAAVTGKRQIYLGPESRMVFALRAPLRVRVS